MNFRECIMVGFDNFDNLDNEDLAERLKRKIVLYHSVEAVWKETSADKKTYPRGYERKKTRDIMKDVKKGIKIINKKIPLYIELPTLKEVGNGQVKKVYDENYKDKPDTEEIVCYDSHTQLNNSSNFEELQDSQAKAGFIEDSK